MPIMKQNYFFNPLKTLWCVGVSYGLTTVWSWSATLDWGFVTSNGGTSIEGVFTTDGSLLDTQGTGTHVFNITEWKSLSLNGGETGIPAERFPSSPVSGTFTWDRDGQAVAFPSSVVLSGEHRDEMNNRVSFFQLAFSPAKSTLQDFVDFNPNLSFTPVPANSSFAPIPEPSDYALIGGAALLGWAGWRRYRLRRRAYPLSELSVLSIGYRNTR